MVRIVTDKRHAGADPGAARRLGPVFMAKIMAQPPESYTQDGLISSETPSLEAATSRPASLQAPPATSGKCFRLFYRHKRKEFLYAICNHIYDKSKEATYP